MWKHVFLYADGDKKKCWKFKGFEKVGQLNKMFWVLSSLQKPIWKKISNSR